MSKAARCSGVIKWFSDEKGYGFISQEGRGPDVFVHFKSVRGSGRITLHEGEQVEFEIEDGEKGPRAVNVDRV
jgi:cold shock protein